MGGGGTTTKTTESGTTNQQVTLPQWMSDAGQNLWTQANQAASDHPIQGYGGQMAPGLAANQQRAGNLAAASVGQGQGDLQAARAMTAAAANPAYPTASAPQVRAGQMQAAQQGVTGMTAAQQGVAAAGAAPTMTAASQGATSYNPAMQGQAPTVGADRVASSNFDQAAAARYMSPYTADVQGRTLDEMRRQNSMAQQDLGDQAAAGKAYGGDRYALEQAELQKGQNANMMDYLAKSNADAYANAQGQFNTDRQAGMSADMANQGANLQAATTSAGFLDQLLGRNQDAANTEGAFRASADNAAAGANADRAQQAAAANQQLQGTFSLADQAAANSAAGANADRLQGAGQYNAGAMNSAAGANADRSQAASTTNLSSRNSVNSANADRSFQASQVNAGLGQSFLDRLLQGGAQFGDIGKASSDLTARDIGNLSTTGAVDQSTQSDQDQAAYNEFLRMQDAPMDRYRDLGAILAGTPRNLQTTGSSTGNSTSKVTSQPGLLNMLMSGAQLAGAVASDPRLKRDVALVDRLPNGLGVYRFRYLWDPAGAARRIGVMADEVARVVPEALGPRVLGFLTVDYSKLRRAFA